MRTFLRLLRVTLLLSAALLSATCGEDSSPPTSPEPPPPAPEPTPPPPPPPDLTFRDVRIYFGTGDTPTGPVEPGTQLGLTAPVHNAGGSTAPSTRVTYHRSPQREINRDRLRVGEDNTVALDPGGTQHLAAIVTAPSNPGIYYYGACAEPVSGERVIDNNCSDGVRLEVGSGPQSDDHGDSRSDATRINVPSETDGTLTAGDTDYFRVSVNSPGTLEVYTTGSVHTVGQLEDSDGSRLARNDDSGGPNFRIEREVSSGTYYIRVTGFSRSTAGNYTLHVRFMREDDSPSDLTIRRFSIFLSNGDMATGPVEPGSRLGLAAAVSNIGRSVSPPTVVGFFLSNDSRITTDDSLLKEDTAVSLHPGETQHLAEIVTAPSRPGTYYYGACIDPASREGNTRNNCSDGVRLDVESVVEPDDHGDDRGSATRVGVPSDTSGRLEPGDTDYFRIDVRRSGTLEVYTSGSVDTEGQLEVASGSRLAENNDGSDRNFRIERQVSSGTYYIRVKGYLVIDTGNYTLHVRLREDSPDDHGNSRGDATRINVPSETSGSLIAADTDYFRISVGAGYSRGVHHRFGYRGAT